MSHELEYNNGVWSFVYSPVEGPGWHKHGKSVADDAPVEAWRAAAGHLFTVSRRQVRFVDVNGELIDCPNRFVMARDDNDHALGIASDQYKIVQPVEIDDICDNFAAFADGKLVRSAAFTLRKGDMICSTYAYRDGPFTVGGDKHQAFLMAKTTFDGSGSTEFWVSVIRAVCANTIRAGLASAKGAKVSVRHNSTLRPELVREQLAELAQSVAEFKKLGDALAARKMSKDELRDFIRDVLDIPRDAKQEDVSTRKQNQRQEIIDALLKSATERGNNGASDIDAFTALQGITRYVDHDRSVKVNGSGNETVARFDSANFGSGDLLKAKAVGLLMPLIREKVAA